MENSGIITFRDIKELSDKQLSVIEILKVGDVRQSDLAEQIGIPKSTLSITIEMFEQSGFLVAKKSGRDRIVSLTIHGKSQAKKIDEVKSSDKKPFLVFH